MSKRLLGVVNNLLKLSCVNMLNVDIHNFSQEKEGLCSPLLDYTNPMGQFRNIRQDTAKYNLQWAPHHSVHNVLSTKRKKNQTVEF